jgi:hypothetical protein
MVMGDWNLMGLCESIIWTRHTTSQPVDVKGVDLITGLHTNGCWILKFGELVAVHDGSVFWLPALSI